MVKTFPKINEYGWRLLRPINFHSTTLIPFVTDGPITGQTIKL